MLRKIEREKLRAYAAVLLREASNLLERPTRKDEDQKANNLIEQANDILTICNRTARAPMARHPMKKHYAA